MLQQLCMERIQPSHHEGWDQGLYQLAKFRFKHERALDQAPRREDQILGLETFVRAMAAVLYLLAQFSGLKVVPQPLEIPIIGLEISHGLEEFAERNVAIGVDDAAHIARIARDVLRMSLHFLHVVT